MPDVEVLSKCCQRFFKVLSKFCRSRSFVEVLSKCCQSVEAKASADFIETTSKPLVAQRAGGIMYINRLCLSIDPLGLRSVQLEVSEKLPQG